MAGLIVTKKQLVTLIKRHGGTASLSDSNKTLMAKANKCGLGARKAKPQHLGGKARSGKRRKRADPVAVMAAHRAGRLTQSQAMKKMGLDPQYIQDRLAFERAECSRNPGPDPYSKNMLILDPAGISHTGPFGPFGQYDPQRMRNPGFPSPGQVVGGVGDFMQMNPGMGDYLLEREIAPYEARNNPGRMVCSECGEPAYKRPPRPWGGSSGVDKNRKQWSHKDGEPLCPVMTSKGYQPALPTPATSGNPGLNDYMLLDMTPPAPKKKNPGKAP